jgi:hypothetical protein
MGTIIVSATIYAAVLPPRRLELKEDGCSCACAAQNAEHLHQAGFRTCTGAHQQHLPADSTCTAHGKHMHVLCMVASGGVRINDRHSNGSLILHSCMVQQNIKDYAGLSKSHLPV